MGGWGAKFYILSVAHSHPLPLPGFQAYDYFSQGIVPTKFRGFKSDTLSVLGASPLKKPAAPSSFAITLKQSIIPLYDWTFPKLSLAWWKPCTFKKWGAPLIIDHHYIFNVWHCSYDSQEELWDEWFTCITMGLFCLLTWSDPWLPCGECHETHFWSCSPKNDNETRN